MDLQKYPRNRKSKRKQQPEALDSKICSTFPVMAGSSLVRMPDQKVYLFNFFFWCPKVLIEEPAHTDHVNIVTAASGPLPEALALVLPDSELPAF
jgi:hypothetical protein